MIKYLVILVFIFVTVYSYGQEDVIDVSFDKSVMVIFGSVPNDGNTVLNVNVGSPELISSHKSRNKVLLQAKEEYFSETNLFVELTNGEVYSFLLRFKNAPEQLKHTIEVSDDSLVKPPKSADNKVNTVAEGGKGVETNNTTKAKANVPAEILKNCQYYVSEKDYLSRIAVVMPKFVFYVGGIWIGSDDRMYFKVNLENQSAINYDIGSKNFFVKKHKSADLEKYKPEYVFNEENKVVAGNSTGTFILVFKKFTIGGKDKFVMQYWEKDGARNLELKIDYTEILNAKPGL